VSEGLAASNLSLLRLLLAPLISDLEALRHDVTTRFTEMSRTFSEVNAELSTIRYEVDSLRSDDDNVSTA
jgi:hypothetical protein